MVVLDPFSAASKPMPDWESMPSRPLPFAATLHALDVNVQTIQRLPRPIRHDRGLDGERGTYSLENGPRRMSVCSPRHAPSRTPLSPSGSSSTPVGSDTWMEAMVADCVDKAKGDLVIHDYGLKTLSTKIRDLRDLVTLSRKSPPTSPGMSSLRLTASPCPSRTTLTERDRGSIPSPLISGQRNFSRTHSAPPVSAAFFAGLHAESADMRNDNSSQNSLQPAPRICARTTPTSQPARSDLSVVTTRPFHRSKTGAPTLPRTTPSIGVYASQNLLTSLPTALFEIRNLTALSLRNNQLRYIPAAIGELVHLKELNISNNQIEFLPSTMLKLDSLEQFWAHPNRWRQAPSDGMTCHNGRQLGPLFQHQDHSVPSLFSLCLTVLLSPRPPSNQPPFLGFDWDSCPDSKGDKHPLLDASRLRDYLPASMKDADILRILQAVKSASRTGERSVSQVRRNAWPALSKNSEPDDAADNAYYYPCPSPKHLEWYTGKDIDAQPIAHRVFLHPAEERFEWRAIANAKDLPVKWQGCSKGCLDFLEDEDDEDWPLDELADVESEEA